MRFRARHFPLCVLALALASPLRAEEKNGIQYSVQKVTLDRADTRVDFNSENLDRMMGLRVSLRNTSFKPIPEGQITWEIIKRRYDNQNIELTTGTQNFAGLKAGESVELTMGAARVAGIRNGAILRLDEIEWQITILHGPQEVARFSSKSSFPLLLKRATKVDVPGTPAPAPAPAAAATAPAATPAPAPAPAAAAPPVPPVPAPPAPKP